MNVFQQNRLIPYKVNVHLELIFAANNYVCKSVVYNKQSMQQNYKAVISFLYLSCTQSSWLAKQNVLTKLFRKKSNAYAVHARAGQALSIPQN